MALTFGYIRLLTLDATRLSIRSDHFEMWRLDTWKQAIRKRRATLK